MHAERDERADSGKSECTFLAVLLSEPGAHEQHEHGGESDGGQCSARPSSCHQHLKEVAVRLLDEALYGCRLNTPERFAKRPQA